MKYKELKNQLESLNAHYNRIENLYVNEKHLFFSYTFQSKLENMLHEYQQIHDSLLKNIEEYRNGLFFYYFGQDIGIIHSQIMNLDIQLTQIMQSIDNLMKKYYG